MMPPSKFALRIVVEEDPKLVRVLNANYANAEPDGGLDTAEWNALLDVLALHRSVMASLWRHGRYTAVLGRPPARHGCHRMEGRYLFVCRVTATNNTIKATTPTVASGITAGLIISTTSCQPRVS
jgi:hypothetical protein